MSNTLFFSTRWLASIVCTLILLVGLVCSFQKISQQIPLLNHDMRVGEPWYTQTSRNMYHPARYYVEKSQEFLRKARTENTQQNLEKSIEIALRALEKQPNNPYALVVLGMAYAASSQPQKSIEALVKTYDLTPYHRNISLQRLQILQAYWADLTVEQRFLVLRDVKNLQSVESWKLRQLARQIPFVKTLIDQQDQPTASPK
jgi:tetratricopeptide (TPR) repeat protein